MNKQLPVILFPLAKLVLHLATHRGYGMFRDEYYYLACSENLAWGYVDHPPLSVALLAGARAVFGDSLLAVRLLPAIAGALTVLLVGLIARGLGGGRFAQSLAMLAALVAPIYLGLDHFFSMNAFDLLVWAAAAWLLVRILRGADPRLWLVLGAVLGLGLLNKISVLWLGFGLAVGLLGTGMRRTLRTPWPWAAAAISGLLFLPHLLWQVRHGWPTLEFVRNATGEKMVDVQPLEFLGSQVTMMNPATLPLWLAGLAWLLFGRKGRPFRLLGVVYLAVFALLVLSGTSRAGYLAPAYTWLLAAGGVAAEMGFERARVPWARWAAGVVLAAAGVVLAPFALPVLPVETYIAYARSMGVEPSTEERKELSDLPQHYADMHGWEEIVRTVAEVFDGLSPEEQAKAAIFTYNYGDAGAIDRLGRPLGLPRAISGHNSYWLWGPRDRTGEVLIVLGNTRENLLRRFEQVELGATVECFHCMPYENHRPVWICRDIDRPLNEVWADLKHFD